MARFFDEVDLLVTPTMPVLPRHAGRLGSRGLTRTLALMMPCAAYTGPWNACGLPAMSVPVGMSAAGVPIGIQLIGPAGGEARLFAVAAALQEQLGWLDRRAGAD
jgi:amidase